MNTSMDPKFISLGIFCTLFGAAMSALAVEEMAPERLFLLGVIIFILGALFVYRGIYGKWPAVGPEGGM